MIPSYDQIVRKLFVILVEDGFHSKLDFSVLVQKLFPTRLDTHVPGNRIKSIITHYAYHDQSRNKNVFFHMENLLKPSLLGIS